MIAHKCYIGRQIGVFAVVAMLCVVGNALRSPLARAGGHNRTCASAPRLPKLRMCARNPHLIEDENGKPFFVAGFCPQNIIHWCTPAQMDTYFAARQARHFNFAWVMITGWNVRGVSDMTAANPAENPVDASGNWMLLKGTSWYPRNVNSAYVASVDAMVRSAAAHGIYLFLDRCNSAYEPRAGNFDPAKHSTDEMRQWGEFWGNRYKEYSHINFALGSDKLVWPQVDSIVAGIKKYMPDRLMTVDWIDGPPNWNCELTSPHKLYQGGHRWVNLNAWYEWRAPQWATWYHYQMEKPAMPTCIFETLYEGVATGTPNHIPPPPQMIRGQEWGTVLNGGSGFGILGSPDWLEDPIRWLGKTPVVEQAEYCTTFFMARPWFYLIPDWSHKFLTSQTSDPAKDDYTYVSAALTRDGSLGVCYYPGDNGPGFRLTVNMSKIGSGTGNSRVRWYDPTNGTYKPVDNLENAGSHTFITPGANSKGAADWVLVLERN